MSRVLLIDDLRNFRPGMLAEGTDLRIARTSEEAFEILRAVNDWDEIWFDHDLGELPNGRLDTTMGVLDYLAEKAFQGAPVNVGHVYVHTSNSVGRKQIMDSLRRYGYAATPVDAAKIFIV